MILSLSSQYSVVEYFEKNSNLIINLTITFLTKIVYWCTLIKDKKITGIKLVFYHNNIIDILNTLLNWKPIPFWEPWKIHYLIISWYFNLWKLLKTFEIIDTMRNTFLLYWLLVI